jgi:hypothetical protein
MKPIPFLAKRPKLVVVPVGTEATGFVYLQKQGFITPNENPVDFQEAQRKQRKFFTAYNKRIKELARDLDMSQAEVRTKLGSLSAGASASDGMDIQKQAMARWRREFRAQNKRSPNTDEDLTQKAELRKAWVAEFEDKQGRSPSSDEIPEYFFIPSDEDDETMIDYLDDDTLELMYSLQEDARTLAIRAATYMLQHRAAVPVIVREDADAGARQLKIEPLTTPMGSEDIVRFDDYVVAARGAANYGSELLDVKDTPIKLTKGQVGYLCDRASAQVKVGFLDWSVEDTENYLGEDLIGSLYGFYQVEAGEAADISDEMKELEGEVEIDAEGESEMTTPSLIGVQSS